MFCRVGSLKLCFLEKKVRYPVKVVEESLNKRRGVSWAVEVLRVTRKPKLL